MKKIFLFILILILPLMVRAEEFRQDFFVNYQTANTGDFPVAYYDDGSFIMGITSDSDVDFTINGTTDIIYTKYNKSGEIVWKKQWGGNSTEVIYDIDITSDGGFVLVGTSSSTDIVGAEGKETNNSFVVKCNSEGEIDWQNTWGGNGVESFTKSVVTGKDHIVVIGNFNSTNIDGVKNNGGQDAVIVKYDISGNLLWQKSWGGTGSDRFYHIFLENDNFLILGNSSSTDLVEISNRGKSDELLISIDSQGNINWATNFGGNSADLILSYIELEDSFIISTQSQSSDIPGTVYNGSIDALLTKIGKDGTIYWQKCFGGSGADYIKNIFETSNGDYVIVGSFNSTDISGVLNNGSSDAIIAKLDKEGNVLWQKSWGGTEADSFSVVSLDKFDNILVGGTFNSTDIPGLINAGASDLVFIKYTTDGDILWQRSWGGSGSESIFTIVQILANEYFFSSQTTSKDIDGIINESKQNLIMKYSMLYNIDAKTLSENGTVTAVQSGGFGIVTPVPDKGYEVDKIIIKDKEGNALDINVVELEDGKYSFDLYTDVNVEVTFREKIENPKTGVINMMILVPVIILLLLCLHLIDEYSLKF